MRTFLHSIIVAAFIGVSISGAILAFVLLSLLGRYSKDLAEVLATWQYVTAAVVVSVIAAAFAVRLYASGIVDMPDTVQRP